MGVSRLFCCFALALTMMSTRLYAGESDMKQARQEFENGKAFFEKGKFIEAADAFRRAASVKSSWRIQYNIGQSEAAAKRYGLALEAFEKYLVQGGDDVPAARQEEVQNEVKRLKGLVGMLEVTAPDGADIFVDDIRRGQAPLAGVIPVSAGMMHTLSAKLDGVTISERPAKVMGEQTLAVKLEAAAAPPPPKTEEEEIEPQEETEEAASATEAEEAPREKMPPLRLWGWIATGVGAGVLVGGVVTGSMAMSKDGDIADNCPDGECDPKWQDTLDQRDTLGTVTDVLLISGGVIAAAGVTMLLISYLKKEDEAANAKVPAVRLGMTGAALEWRF